MTNQEKIQALRELAAWMTEKQIHFIAFNDGLEIFETNPDSMVESSVAFFETACITPFKIIDAANRLEATHE